MLLGFALADCVRRGCCRPYRGFANSVRPHSWILGLTPKAKCCRHVRG